MIHLQKTIHAIIKLRKRFPLIRPLFSEADFHLGLYFSVSDDVMWLLIVRGRLTIN